ncbi:MAG: hypothetical protein Q7T71_05135 [Herbiconiux sp.]|nr:hypothetical protein [Herbiconiux sp.]
MTTKTRAAGIAAAFLIVLTASGCVGTTDPAPSPGPTAPTVTAGPATATVPATPLATSTPDPAASATPTPDAGPAYDPADPATWTIDFTGIGPVILGRPLGELPTVVPFSTDSCRPGVYLWPEIGLVASGSATDEAGPVTLALVSTRDDGPTPSTEAGIHIGSTIAELQAAYPELASQARFDDSLQYSITDGTTFIHFVDYGSGTLKSIDVSAAEMSPKEYCG